MPPLRPQAGRILAAAAAVAAAALLESAALAWSS
jgi:hypothetical protein